MCYRITEHQITASRKVIAMKKKIVFLLSIAAALLLSACGQNETVNSEETGSIDGEGNVLKAHVNSLSAPSFDSVEEATANE